MFEYRKLNDRIKYQQQWIAQGFTVAFTVDWYDFRKSMTIAEYHEKHLTIIRTHDTLKEKMRDKDWCVKKRKIGKNKRRYWFLFKNDTHLLTAIIHTNITLLNDN